MCVCVCGGASIHFNCEWLQVFAGGRSSFYIQHRASTSHLSPLCLLAPWRGGSGRPRLSCRPTWGASLAPPPPAPVRQSKSQEPASGEKPARIGEDGLNSSCFWGPGQLPCPPVCALVNDPAGRRGPGGHLQPAELGEQPRAALCAQVPAVSSRLIVALRNSRASSWFPLGTRGWGGGWCGGGEGAPYPPKTLKQMIHI